MKIVTTFLKVPNGAAGQSRPLCEILLRPIEKAPSGPALFRRKHHEKTCAL
ncbi:hypothetical protein FHS85_004854 [Rhodoligotrophos appendicifer]